MTASDALQPKQFFHGTHARLKPGELVRPASQGYAPNSRLTNVGVAYATTDMASASNYARLAANEQGTRSRHVYEVEPVGKASLDPNHPNSHVADAWTVRRRVPKQEQAQVSSRQLGEILKQVRR